MTQPDGSHSNRPAAAPDPDRFRRLVTGIAGLVATFSGSVAVAAIVIGDRPGFVAALGFAILFTLPSCLAGWILAQPRARGAARSVARPLAAVAVRILPPLAALSLLTSQQAAPLRAAGAGPMIVGFYLAMLATDILLHIMMGRSHTGRPGAAASPDRSH